MAEHSPEGIAPSSPWKRVWPCAGGAHSSSQAAPPSSWRKLVDEGNRFFISAKAATSTMNRKLAVKDALNKYTIALPLAVEAHQQASTNKNMFVASGLIAADEDALPEDRYYYLREALTTAANALAFGAHAHLQSEWIGSLIDKVNHLVCSSIVDATNIVSSRSGSALQLLTTVVHAPTTQQHLRVIVALALLDRTNKKGALAIADGDHHQGLVIVDERAALMDSTAEWGSQPQCVGFVDAIHSTQASLRNTGSLATAKKQLQKGKKLREESVVDGIDMDKLFEAMDALRLGVVECHDMHLDIEAELLSEIGYIWSNVLKVKEAAHRAYRASLLCAHACSPRVFTSHAWFKRARDAEEEFQQEEALEEKRKKDEADAPFLKELEPELTALKANNTSIDAALK
ncbi:Hypothetical protein, putative, partial [Bodo saltans]